MTPLRIAIIGSGPAGCFTAEELLRGPRPVEIHIFEKLPQPFGLVRYGVAPDHPNTRRIARALEKTLAHPAVRLLTGVEVGRDVSVANLKAEFDAVVVATGASDDRPLGIPGEHLPHVLPSLAFAGWANGHPAYSDLPIDLDVEDVVIIGNGNVALDVARLLARTPAELALTDMAPAAREKLARHRIRRIRIVGRRGPVQASFGENEILEIGAMQGIAFRVDPVVAMPDRTDEIELAAPESDRARAVVAALRSYASRPLPSDPRIELSFDFLRRPLAIRGGGRARELTLELCRLEGEPFQRRAVPTGALQKVDAGLVIISIGHRGRALPGLPFDEERGVIPAERGRVAPGVYAVGWIKRGARGLIGHNRRDAMETAAAIFSDFARARS
jgi:ferredoxin--NADP+ reductase